MEKLKARTGSCFRRFTGDYFVIILQVLLRLPLQVMAQFLIGAAMVTIGLALFLLGVQLGLLQVGEAAGAALPKIGKVWVLVFFGFF